MIDSTLNVERYYNIWINIFFLDKRKVFLEKRPFGLISFWINIHSGCYPFGILLFIRTNVHSS